MKKLKAVQVDWVDAHVWNGWRSEDEAKEILPAMSRTVGYLLTQTKEYVKLTHGYSEENDLYDGVHVIPKSWVTKITALQVEK